jgi:hypothetical protein
MLSIALSATVALEQGNEVEANNVLEGGGDIQTTVSVGINTGNNK